MGKKLSPILMISYSFLSATWRRYILDDRVNASVRSKCDDFMKCLNVLTGKLIRKGFKKNELDNTLSKCYRNYPWIVNKYKL